MATLSDGAFRFLSLCAPPPGSAAVAQPLKSALSAVLVIDEPATAAEQHASMSFYDFDEYERLVAAASSLDAALLIVLLGGEAEFRCGEIALE